MPPYRNTHQTLSGSSGANTGMAADVFDDMARNMRDAFAESFEGVGVNPFTSGSAAPPTAGQGASANPSPPTNGPNVGNPVNGAGFQFYFAATPGEHHLPREGPPPPLFNEHESRRYGFNWTESTAQGAAHPGSKPFDPSQNKDSEPRHHHHHNHHHGGPGNSGRFNPYGRGGPPPHFHHRHHCRPPPPFSHGDFPFGFGGPRPFPFGLGGPRPFPFGFGGPFNHDGPLGFGGPWNRRPPPPPFASNTEERFEHMRQQGEEFWKKLFERMGEINDRMNDAPNAHHHNFSSGFRFEGRAHDGYHYRSRHDENAQPRARSVDIAKAWETYSDQWKKLAATDAPSTISISEIPWPVIIDTSKMKALSEISSYVTATTVGEFILSPKHSLDVSNKKRIHQALRLYHPDRFETVVVAKVEEKVQKLVRELGEVVAKCLNKLLEKEK